jgi:nitrite reductase (NO-forming)
MKATIKTLIAGLLMVLLLSACGGSAANKVTYSLKSNLQDGKMVLVGVGGKIDGVVSPTLNANVGDTVEITFINGDGIEHDLAFPDFNANSGPIMGQGSNTTLSFVADKSGTFTYTCTIPGHIEAGMYGTFQVNPDPAQ